MDQLEACLHSGRMPPLFNFSEGAVLRLSPVLHVHLYERVCRNVLPTGPLLCSTLDWIHMCTNCVSLEVNTHLQAAASRTSPYTYNHHPPQPSLKSPCSNEQTTRVCYKISFSTYPTKLMLSSQTQSAYMAVGSLLRLSLPRPRIHFPTKCSHPQPRPRIYFPTKCSIHRLVWQTRGALLHTRSGMHTHTKHLMAIIV